MGIVLPYGVLFRGAAEGKIREKLLCSGNIYAVIGLSANLFYNMSSSTCIVVLKKHRDGRDVLFIDASKKFEKGKEQNIMTDEHIDSIVDLYLKANEIGITGDYPVYGGNGLRGYTSIYSHEGEFALIGRQGALCGNMNYFVGKAYFIEHATVVKTDENNDTKFMYYRLDTMSLGQYSD